MKKYKVGSIYTNQKKLVHSQLFIKLKKNKLGAGNMKTYYHIFKFIKKKFKFKVSGKEKTF